MFLFLFVTGVTVVRAYFVILAFFFAQTVFAGQFETCLAGSKKIAHRLNRVEAIQDCFDSNKESMTADACFAGIKSVQIHEKSIELNEKLNSICFYDVSRFKKISICLSKVDVFKIANNHDEAVFECYREFQNQLSQKQCLKVSSLMKYPAKKEYLDNHCYENAE